MNEILNSRHLSQMNPSQKDEKMDEIQNLRHALIDETPMG
jgi:hypothetical protein